MNPMSDEIWLSIYCLQKYDLEKWKLPGMYVLHC